MTGWIDRPLTTLAFCWRLERRDGVTLGFTSHDRDIVRDGLRYRAAPGMLPSAITRSDGFDLDNVDISGALSAAAISAADLEAGRWDGAALRLFALDWEAPGEAIHLARGELGTVELVDGRFTAELRGPTVVLECPVTEETSPECRALFGDRRCRVDMAGRERMVRIVAVAGRTLTVDRTEPEANAYGHGALRWLSGRNAGLRGAIAQSNADRIGLRETPIGPVSPGDRALLIQGCDKRLATCAERFGNAINFRGEPWLPGNDLLMRYPDAE